MTFDEAKYLNFTREPDFQKILTNPILDIAARFWDDERYNAFRVCYRSMRIIDDLIDERKATGEPITDSEKQEMAITLANWYEAFKANRPGDDFQRQLLETTERFEIPTWPWQRLLKAMLYDLDHNGFGNFGVFLRYTEGAAIAPAAVFMHLCGVNESDGTYQTPSFDIRKAARPLALFSYLVHIVRDFQKDHLDGLNYFAANLMEQFRLNHNSLGEIARGGAVTAGFRQMAGKYKDFAEYYRLRARQTLDSIRPKLLPPYQLSLEIIYSLYLQIFERIDIDNGTFTTAELNPSPSEVQNRIVQTVTNFAPAQ